MSARKLFEASEHKKLPGAPEKRGHARGFENRGDDTFGRRIELLLSCYKYATMSAVTA